jgi:hypothetical protein
VNKMAGNVNKMAEHVNKMEGHVNKMAGQDWRDVVLLLWNCWTEENVLRASSPYHWPFLPTIHCPKQPLPTPRNILDVSFARFSLSLLHVIQHILQKWSVRYLRLHCSIRPTPMITCKLQTRPLAREEKGWDTPTFTSRAAKRPCFKGTHLVRVSYWTIGRIFLFMKPISAELPLAGGCCFRNAIWFGCAVLRWAVP